MADSTDCSSLRLIPHGDEFVRFILDGVPLAVEDVSTEMLFHDIRDQLTGLTLFVKCDQVIGLLPSDQTAQVVRSRLTALPANQWRPAWRKAVNKNPRRKAPEVKKAGAHTSVYRLLQKQKSGDDG